MLRDFAIRLCCLFTVESTTHREVVSIFHITTETERGSVVGFKEVIVK